MADQHAAELRSLLGLSADLLCVLSPDGRLRAHSASWRAVLGLTDAELADRSLAELLHPDDRGAVRQALASALVPGHVVPVEARCRRGDGTYRTVSWSWQGDEASAAVVGVGRDVTEQRRRARLEREVQHLAVAVTATRHVRELVDTLAEQARLLLSAEHVRVALYAGGGPSGGRRLSAGSGPLPTPAAQLVAVPVRSGGRELATVEVHRPAPLDEAERWAVEEVARLAAAALERLQAARLGDTAEALVRDVLEAVGEAVLLLDERHRCTYVNRAAQELLGRPRERLLGRCLWDEVPELAEERLRRELGRAGAGDTPVQLLEHVGGLDRWFDIRLYPAPAGVVVSLADASERVRATQELVARAAQQHVVAEVGRAALSGLPLGEVFDKVVSQTVNALDADAVAVLQIGPGGRSVRVRARSGAPRAPTDDHPVIPGSSVDTAIRTGRPAVASYDGADLPDEAAAALQRLGARSDAAAPIGPAGSPWGVLVALSEHPRSFGDSDALFLSQVGNVLATAQERHQAVEEMRHQATHDALTTLPNRTLLRERLEDAAERAVVRDGLASLLLLDLDGFKDVNDTLGHAAGDAVLQQVADRLRACTGPDDTVARLGGDEFAVCPSGPVTHSAAAALAERVLALFDTPFDVAGLEIPLAASVGVVLAPTHGADASVLLRHADVAMYRAKATGGGWVLYDPSIDAARSERLTFLAALRAGLRRGELTVHYQPIVDLRTGDIAGLEALARWTSSERGSVPPSEFIPVAESAGLIGEVTEVVLEQVLSDVHRWETAALVPSVAVNLSVAALRDAACATRIVSRLVDSRDRLAVEVTESSLADARARSVLETLSGAGVHCSIDDFGTGYASMASLKSLPVHRLKVDRVFVQELQGKDLAIVRSVVDLATALGLAVVAEGVESEEAVERLRTLGVRYAQGFLYARPMPPEQVERWLLERRDEQRARRLART